jgi:hypothetical protein
MFSKEQLAIALHKKESSKVLNQPRENLFLGLEEIIQIRELDKRHTHANPRRGRCTMEGCTNQATHWLTRNNSNYCQSDMVCHKDAIIWMQVKELISESSLSRN